MEKIDLGKSVQVLANVGVIAGIVLLAVELRQNNALLAAQVRYDRLVIRTTSSTQLLDSVDLASIDFKATAGQELTEQETKALYLFGINTFVTWEWQYDEVLAGTIEDGRLPVGGWRRQAVAYDPAWRDAWQDYSSDPERAPGFVAFMNENVFSALD